MSIPYTKAVTNSSWDQSSWNWAVFCYQDACRKIGNTSLAIREGIRDE